MKTALISRRKTEERRSEDLKLIILYWRWWHVRINYLCLSLCWITGGNTLWHSEFISLSQTPADVLCGQIFQLTKCPEGTHANRLHMQTNLVKILQMKFGVGFVGSSGIHWKLSAAPRQQLCHPSANFKYKPSPLSFFLCRARKSSLTFSQSARTQPESGQNRSSVTLMHILVFPASSFASTNLGGFWCRQDAKTHSRQKM